MALGSVWEAGKVVASQEKPCACLFFLLAFLRLRSSLQPKHGCRQSFVWFTCRIESRCGASLKRGLHLEKNNNRFSSHFVFVLPKLPHRLTRLLSGPFASSARGERHVAAEPLPPLWASLGFPKAHQSFSCQWAAVCKRVTH